MSDAQQPLNALPQGHRLQEYELVRVLGVGGFGMTYLGFDHNLDKAVAIKEYLPSDIATRTTDGSVAPQASEFRGDFQWGLDRFLDEARTLARFDHRHIVKVHRFFEAHGTAYIVMEYAEGETLSAYLEHKGTLTEAELKGILYPILDGLAVVHEANFLHRDIKPGNIILRAEDSLPVLLDFGAARQAIGAKSRSVTSIVTPGYAPIEQYSSRGHQGAWSDIYALGGVCYRALTGDVPDDATDRIRHDPLVPVSQRCVGQASQAFLSTIDKALSMDERERPQSVGAWREALEAGAGEAQELVDDLAGASPPQKQPSTSPPSSLEDLTEASPPQKQPSTPSLSSLEDLTGASPPQKQPSTSPPSPLEDLTEASPPHKQPLRKRLAVVLGVVVALLVGGKMYVDHAEQTVLEKQLQAQAVEEARLAAEQAEEQRQEEQAALEKQRREQAVLEKQRREQAALEKQRREQAALEKQRREQAALEKQRREQAAPKKVCVTSRESNLDRPLFIPSIESVIKDRIGEYGFEFVQQCSQADFIISVESQTRRGGRFQQIYFSYLDAKLSVRDQNSNNEVANTALSNIKGAGPTYEQAGLKAYEKAGEHLEKQVLSDLIETLNQTLNQ